MKVLVATRGTQGLRPRDLWQGCVEGELVRPVEERCSARRDATCSCETAFVGLASGGLTTTAEVREVPGLTWRAYTDGLRRSLTAEESLWVVVPRYAEELVRVAEGLDGQGVVERWDEWVRSRFGADDELLPDVAALADDPEQLARLDEEAEIEDRWAMEERRASGELERRTPPRRPSDRRPRGRLSARGRRPGR